MRNELGRPKRLSSSSRITRSNSPGMLTRPGQRSHAVFRRHWISLCTNSRSTPIWAGSGISENPPLQELRSLAVERPFNKLFVFYHASDELLHAVRLMHGARRSEEHTSELQSRGHLVCRLLLE